MSNNKEQQHISVLFDIDSASVAVVVVGYLPSKKLPTHEFFSRRIQLDTHASFETFFARTIKTIELLGNEAARHTPEAIDSIYMSLSVPWMSSQKRKIQYSKKGEAFLFTKEHAQKLIDKELSEPLATNLDYHHYDDLNIFERKTVDIYLNGYSTLNPFATKTKVKDVELHSLTSVISKTTQDAFEHAVERVFHRKPTLLSNTLVQYKALTTFIPNENSAMIIDIGGTNTQVLVVHDDHLVEIASFPIGREHIVEEVMKQASVSKEKARSLIQLYTHNTLHAEYQQSLQKVMSLAYRVWMEPWFELCDVMSSKKLLPGTFCMTAPDDISDWLRYHILSTDELMEHTHTSRVPQIIDMSLFLQSLASDLQVEHLSDSEIIPLADVVGSMVKEKKSLYE